jgi:DNA-binding NtrC family response regulator
MNYPTNCRRVAILDDCEGPRETYKAMLRKLSIFPLEIVEFSDGDAAWEDLSQRRAHLVITDVCHAGLGCAEMLRRLDRLYTHLWVAVISASSHDLQNVLPEDSNLNVRFLAKPFTYPQFVAAVAMVVHPLETPFGALAPHRELGARNL